jgi:hypothetical protein
MSRAGKSLAAALLAALALAGIGAAPAGAAFGLHGLDVTFTSGPEGSTQSQAGSHPFAFTTTLDANSSIVEGKEVPDGGEIKDLRVSFPPGIAGNPTAVQQCSEADFLDFIPGGNELPACPNSTALGLVHLRYGLGPVKEATTVVYNLIPAPGVAAKIGFMAPDGFPVTTDVGLSPQAPYHLEAQATNVTQTAFFYGATLTVWGNPTAEAHDSQRGTCLVEGGSCPVPREKKPFITLPTSCSGPLLTGFEVDSWQNPGAFTEPLFAETHDSSEPPVPLGMTGCGNLVFAPHTSAQPTSPSAESSTGLDFSIDVKDEGLTENPAGNAQSDIKELTLALPAGVTANPSAAEGLGVCAPAQYEAERIDTAPGQGCPEESKLGSVEVETPLLENETLPGSVFLAQQDDPATARPGAENPFDSLLALYVVIRDPKLGILVKLPVKVEPDPKTGQLIATATDLPQFPFSHFGMHLREGPRAPLITPPTCGTYTTEALLTPWSGGATLPANSTFRVTSGVNGGPCPPPSGVPPFHPGFSAGSVNNNAGSYSPFDMRLTRGDGEQDITRFDAVLPPGVLAKLAGVAKCPAAQIAAARAKTGRQELASPSCPAASEIGHVEAGAGVGTQLTYVPGTLYLAGPFGGDPLSVVAIVPAVAGPFDVGTVVTQVALTLNPETGEAEVDGAHSEPIPHILKGIPLKLRDLRVDADRPNFTLNPTSCAPEAARATLWGSGADVFSSADDVPVPLTAGYQAASCASLRFAPKLSLKLKGGTRRGAYPALKATIDYPPGAGYANIGAAVVTLPHSAFLEQAHIRTVCTRVQFAANACPAGSIYGRARATSPLLDEPLEGPVYLRSSNHPLPDLVFALRGLVNINVAGRVDSVNARIRTSFESIPDAPISKFTLEMKGGKKGLIVNSRDLCTHKSKAVSELTGQNGRAYDTQPVVKVDCGKTAKSKRR